MDAIIMVSGSVKYCEIRHLHLFEVYLTYTGRTSSR